MAELRLHAIAMDFWASVEHAIYYKYDAEVPSNLFEELSDAARTTAALDSRMTRLVTRRAA